MDAVTAHPTMIPWQRIPPVDLGFVTVDPFGICVSIAIVLGAWLTLRRARQLGLDGHVMYDVMIWAIIPGFIVSHWFAVLVYARGDLVEDPLALLKVWGRMSSFGGFLGSAMGVTFYLRRKKLPMLSYMDPVMYGFVAAWIVGRLGCTIAFDHPGTLTDFFLGMPYPGGDEASAGIRHNLGFYEAVFSIVLFSYLFLRRNKADFAGWVTLTTVLVYMPFRFVLDFYRVADETYAGLTGAQIAAIALFALVVWVRFFRVDQNRLPVRT